MASLFHGPLDSRLRGNDRLGTLLNKPVGIVLRPDPPRQCDPECHCRVYDRFLRGNLLAIPIASAENRGSVAVCTVRPLLWESFALEIKSLDHTWTLTLCVTDVKTEQFPSVQVSVELEGEFSARIPDVFYEPCRLTTFDSALRKLERSRAGDAVLDSCSPGECSIRIECVGGRGNILLHVDMWRMAYFREAGGAAQNTVSVTFEIDREFLHRIISDFAKLAST